MVSSKMINANNKLDSITSFNSRILYKYFAYSFDADTKNSDFPTPSILGIKNYWFLETLLFGKVDPNFVGVQPLPGGLVQMDGANGSVYALDFVVKAFKKFQQFFVLPLKEGRLEGQTRLSTPMAFKAFENGENIYNDYLNKLMLRFNSTYLNVLDRANKVFNIKDYCQLFFDFFLNHDKYKYLSKSSFLLSSRTSALSSGLCIEIADLDPSNDKEKMDFITLVNFPFYREAAINAGFLIDKNIPWRLNIDLSSPVIIERLGYSKQNSAGTPINVFADYFRTSYNLDLDYIKTAILSGYNSLVQNHRFFRSGNCLKSRDPQTLEGLDNSLGIKYWIKKYILIKNKEKNYPYDKQEVDRIITNSNARLKFNSDVGTIAYINEKFKLPYPQPGSLVYEKLKEEFRETGDFPLDNFSEYVIMLVKQQLNTIY